MKPKFQNPTRNDPAGHGHFGAKRGGHTHRGVDHVCIVGSDVISCVTGRVTKQGYCYHNGYGGYSDENHEKYRYVEVTTDKKFKHRFLYVFPKTFTIGREIFADISILGTAQDITKRYPDRGMLPHIHFEIFTGNKEKYYDPDEFIEPGEIA